MFEVLCTILKCLKTSTKVGFFLFFFDNYIQIGCGNFPVLWRENLPLVVNLLTKIPKILDLIKREVSQLNLSQNYEKIGQKICHADFSSFWDPLTYSLLKKDLKQNLFVI